ncbi:hypothetical protein GYMLUDRAFT_242290 [Collybiopsis luxurians FD-317 M1]|uniref:Uncharacterized protein n=1 Tax=Collybiopsis luxurians FD-317 M1 TaxID=944289 RepID=A0A0D0CK53_9AGAR|nr:hypothetical protein GYMLUDRAFT_242290 [Collybiopsis luxurians FD-317 M1]
MSNTETYKKTEEERIQEEIDWLATEEQLEMERAQIHRESIAFQRMQLEQVKQTVEEEQKQKKEEKHQKVEAEAERKAEAARRAEEEKRGRRSKKTQSRLKKRPKERKRKKQRYGSSSWGRWPAVQNWD